MRSRAEGLSGLGGPRFSRICLLRVDQLGAHAKGPENPDSAGRTAILMKARDKFVAHPTLRGRVRNAHGAMSIPRVGILHPYAVHADEKDPVLLEYYGGSFAPKSAADEARLRGENERLILSPKKNSEFSSTNCCASRHLVSVSQARRRVLRRWRACCLTSALPEIERISAQPIPARRLGLGNPSQNLLKQTLRISKLSRERRTICMFVMIARRRSAQWPWVVGVTLSVLALGRPDDLLIRASHEIEEAEKARHGG